MKLYICGNGFDCHNRFKTDFQYYKDFLQSHYRFDKFHYGIVERSIKYSYTLFHEHDNWSDVEKNLTFNYKKYIADYCNCFNRKRVSPGESLPETDEVILEQFRTEDFSNDLSYFTGICYFEWIKETYNSRIAEGEPYPDDIPFLLGNSEDKFVNFNYTPTLQYIYKIPENNILHIHGKLLDVDESSIQITTNMPNGSSMCETRNDFARVMQFGSIENDPTRIKDELKSFAVSPQNDMFSIQNMLDNIERICICTYKDIQSNYKKLFDFINQKQIADVVIMGHSFWGVDEPYYERIIVPALKNSRWTFYCHPKEQNNPDKEAAQQFAAKNKIALSDNPFVEW